MNKDNAKDFLPLVQALADGKLIQIARVTGEWVDLGEEVRFGAHPAEYRIKPEPREVWVNEYPKGTRYMWDTKNDALENAAEGAITRRYREVIE